MNVILIFFHCISLKEERLPYIFSVKFCIHLIKTSWIISYSKDYFVLKQVIFYLILSENESIIILSPKEFFFSFSFLINLVLMLLKVGS